MSDFFLHDVSLVPTNVPALVLGLLLAFLTGQILAWVYMATHTGLSYSRTFVNSLVVIPIVVALVMTVLSNNLVTAFGLMAVFAIVRFRNILRDTLDTTYLLSNRPDISQSLTSPHPMLSRKTLLKIGDSCL